MPLPPATRSSDEATASRAYSVSSETTLVPAASTSSETTLVPQPPQIKQQQTTAEQKSKPDVGYKWGITPKASDHTHSKSVSDLPLDHPVHRWTPEEQEEMRKKGVNPILKAEMDAAVSNPDGSKSRKKSFWRSVGTLGMNIK